MFFEKIILLKVWLFFIIGATAIFLVNTSSVYARSCEEEVIIESSCPDGSTEVQKFKDGCGKNLGIESIPFSPRCTKTGEQEINKNLGKSCSPTREDKTYQQCGGTVGLEGQPAHISFKITPIYCNDPRNPAYNTIIDYKNEQLGQVPGLCGIPPDSRKDNYAGPDGGGPAGVVQLQELVLRIINIAVIIAFMALTVVLFVAGFRLLISGGDPKAIGSARNMVIYAISGIVLLAAGWLIIRLISSFTGVPLTNFCIGFPGAKTGC